MRAALILILTAGLAACQPPAPASRAPVDLDPDPVRGRDVAVDQCAACHQVVAVQPPPAAGAPDFKSIARAWAMDDLARFLSQPHPVTVYGGEQIMPTYSLYPDERADLMAYFRAVAVED